MFQLLTVVLLGRWLGYLSISLAICGDRQRRYKNTL